MSIQKKYQLNLFHFIIIISLKIDFKGTNAYYDNVSKHR